MADDKVIEVILHCQRQIKKEGLTEDKLLYYLTRLSRLRVTVQNLADTGIGRTVNSLSRNEGQVGKAAEQLVRGWKRMVSEQQNQAEQESEEESGSNSGSSEEEEEEGNGEDNTLPYEVEDDHVQDRRYSNGHSSYEDLRTTSSVPPPAQRNSRDFDEEDEDDDIDDPYMNEDGGYLDMGKIQVNDEEDEEDDIDEKDSDSGSERLEIDDEEVPVDDRSKYNNKTYNLNVKQERHSSPDERDQKHNMSRSSMDSHQKSHGSDQKKHSGSNSNSSSSSKSHRHHERSSEKSHSKEYKPHHDTKISQSSKDASKDRRKQNSGGSSNNEQLNKYHQHHSSSKMEKSKESKSEPEKSYHHKEKDRHRSKESSSSHSHRDRDREHRDKEIKMEKDRERSSKDKKDSTDYRTSSSSSKSKSRDQSSSSSSQSPKKSSLIDTSKIKEESSLKPSHDDRKRKEHSTSSPSESSTTSKKSKLVLKEEIDNTAGVNFADVLGSLDASAPSKHPSSLKKEKKRDEKSHHRKHHDSHHSSSKKHESSSSSKHSSSRDASSSSKKVDSKKSIPQSKIESVIQPSVNISPNYKPMTSSIAKLGRSSVANGNGAVILPPAAPLSQKDLSDLSAEFWDNNGGGAGKTEMSQEDALMSNMLSSRNKIARSKVFSGAKTGRRGVVPSLYEMCMQVIKDNIGDLGYTGGIPYDILKPALERANPQQLMNIEAQNDYLIGETDELWEFHCKRDFRGQFPEEESWRELYERCTEERRLKFEIVKKQMKKNIEKADPVRKAKLAYVDTTSTTRFNRQKAQTIKNGMKTLKIKAEKGPSRGVSSSASAAFNNPKKASEIQVEEASVIIAPESRAGHAPAPSVSREASAAAKAKVARKAPLMAKTMKLIKSLHRR